MQEFFRDIHIYRIDETTAHFYGQLKTDIVRQFGPKERIKRRGIKITRLGIGENDLWIAAVAVQHGLTIVSADRDFQRMQDARLFPLETWWQPPTDSSL